MATKYYIDIEGHYLGGFDGAEPPEGAIEVENAPDDARDVWDGLKWIKPPETPEQIVARLERALDTYIDSQAQSYRYESIRTMVTYIGDPNAQFNAEGVAALEFRSRCYTLALMIISEVNQGRPVPTEEELIAEMPKLADFVIY